MSNRVVEQLCDVISATGLGRDVIRLARLFPDDAATRHYLLAHALGTAAEPLTEEELEWRLGDMPRLAILANGSMKRMRVLGCQRYLIRQVEKLVVDAKERLDGPVWSPHQIADTIIGDPELMAAVLMLADGLGDASHCFNLAFLVELLQDCIERGDLLAEAQVLTLVQWLGDCEVILPLIEECGDQCLTEATQQYGAFVSTRSGDAYKRALQYWCGNNRMNLLAMYAKELEPDDALFDPDSPVPDEVPQPALADPHDPRHWTTDGGILVPARA